MEHENCHSLGPVDFPPRHFYAPTCSACNIEFFLSDGELARWLVAMYYLCDSPEADCLPWEEQTFYEMLFKDLCDGAYTTQDESEER